MKQNTLGNTDQKQLTKHDMCINMVKRYTGSSFNISIKVFTEST